MPTPHDQSTVTRDAALAALSSALAPAQRSTASGLLPSSCPSCGGLSLRSRGRFPATDLFCGQEIAPTISGGVLAECAGCNLLFKHPLPAKQDLDRRYRQVPAQLWDDDPAGRRDWKVVASLIGRSRAGGRILDIGCYQGGFLAALPDAFEKYGVEINPEAARRATARGIRVIGADYESALATSECFDVITAIDVIEHTLDPADFLRSLARLLAPGGTIVLSTGNTDAASWRFMGGQYWYSAFAEHVTFISPRWAEQAARKVGLRVPAVERFAYLPVRPVPWLRDLAYNALHRVSPEITARIRGIVWRRKGVAERPEFARLPPNWKQARDHVAISFVHA